MLIDWITSHPGYTAFAALWIVALLVRKFAKMRCSRSSYPAAEWTVVILTLAGGGVLIDCVTHGPAEALVYVMASTIIALTEVCVVARAEAEAVNLRETEAADTLLHTQQKLHLHIEQTPLGVMELDLDGRFMEWNSAAERIFGFPREEVIGKDFRELIVPESTRKEVANTWEALMRGATEKGYMTENVTKDGRSILCEWSNTPIRNSDG